MKIYVVDAFTDTVFQGNPAAVCVTDEWLSDPLMQNVAKENNLSETAFAVPAGEHYGLRWFTPGGEIDLCGHATLAAAYVLMRFFVPERSHIAFDTQSGVLAVHKRGELYELDMPAYALLPVPVTDEMEQAIGVRPLEAWIGRDLVCVLPTEQNVIEAVPDERKVKQLDGLLLHVTAAGSAYDCVTRSFAPKLNVTEDPVCGSGHCHVFPLWSGKSGKTELVAFQASQRTGILYGRINGDRVQLAGNAALYSIAELFVPK
ncbi:PhzF family phenazine biosynthesis protein [Saccharibacillus sacchari]|uniref:PhzF family phenazine biosynthesis protein n=1 Tax=Saccharibacillus sacchari TaxID=456493 RepID=A0ACC6P674_9BACL